MEDIPLLADDSWPASPAPNAAPARFTQAAIANLATPMARKRPRAAHAVEHAALVVAAGRSVRKSAAADRNERAGGGQRIGGTGRARCASGRRRNWPLPKSRRPPSRQFWRDRVHPCSKRSCTTRCTTERQPRFVGIIGPSGQKPSDCRRSSPFSPRFQQIANLGQQALLAWVRGGARGAEPKACSSLETTRWPRPRSKSRAPR